MSTEYRMTEIQALRVPSNPTTRDQNVHRTYPHPWQLKKCPLQRLPTKCRQTIVWPRPKYNRCRWIQTPQIPLDPKVGRISRHKSWNVVLHLLVGSYDKQVPLLDYSFIPDRYTGWGNGPWLHERIIQQFLWLISSDKVVQWLQILIVFGCEFSSITTMCLWSPEYMMIDITIYLLISIAYFALSK